jgi:hypothetical protein
LLLLLLFATADLFFVGLHTGFELGFTKDPVFSLEGDRTGGEFWQYVKEYWIVMVMVLLFRRTGQPMYAAWGAVFAYILADDALQIHEKMGVKIAQALGLPTFGNMEGWAIGQILFAGGCAVVLLILMALLYQTASENARRMTLTLLLGLFLVAVFGVGCDALHALVPVDALIVVEEGGELLIMSCVCTAVLSEAGLRVTHRNSAAQPE